MRLPLHTGSFQVMLLLSIACATQPNAPAPSTPPAPQADPAPVIVEDLETASVAEGSPASADPIEAVVSASDRSEADRALDAQRKPSELLRFLEVAPGQRVAELGAGGGYTAELLARTVGPEGKVYGQNSRFILERFAEVPWSERLKKPVMANTVRLDTEFDAPFTTEVKDLDLVLIVLFYHDTVWQGVDRGKMNRAIFDALKPGGLFGIVDHAAKQGRGVADAESLHRIEESTLISEVEAAGFELEASADFLRNPDDARDWNAAPRSAGDRRGTSDRFVLKFRKPNGG